MNLSALRPQKINWEELAAKKVPAPFKPVIRDELDVSNFAEEFTEMDPTYSPAALPQNCDRIFQVQIPLSLSHTPINHTIISVRTGCHYIFPQKAFY